MPIGWNRNAELLGHAREFRKRPRPHLLHDAAAMHLDGLLHDAEFARDLLLKGYRIRVVED
jgi:hypothetical protein